MSSLETLFPKELMGCIIGEKGVKIQEVREKNNVKIHSEKKIVKKDYREIRIDGEWCNVWNAFCELIKTVNEAIEEERITPGSGVLDADQKFTVQIKIPIEIAGPFIGKGGGNLNDWRGRWSEGDFNVDNDPEDNCYRYLRVKGAPYTLCEASVAIADVFEAALQSRQNRNAKKRGNGEGNPDDNFNGQKRRRMGGNMQQNQQMNPNMKNMGNLPMMMETTTQIILDENVIGKVIGQGGYMIKNIRNASSCSITTDRSGERGDSKREIQIQGSLPQLQIALQMVQNAVIMQQ